MKFAIALILSAGAAWAESPQITNVTATQQAGAWRFDVTIQHEDTGWDDYADGWRILDMAGNELGLRELAHPHVDEQPFTRSLGGVKIPEGTKQVRVQARHLPDGWNSDSVVVDLP